MSASVDSHRAILRRHELRCRQQFLRVLVILAAVVSSLAVVGLFDPNRIANGVPAILNLLPEKIDNRLKPPTIKIQDIQKFNRPICALKEKTLQAQA